MGTLGELRLSDPIPRPLTHSGATRIAGAGVNLILTVW